VQEVALMCLGVPVRIVEYVDAANRLASAEVNGARRTVNVALLADEGALPEPGSWVLVHLGFAMERLDEREAAETLRLLEDLGRAPGT
jgi:hydrogenase expression/formation protein HypC